VQRAPRTNYEAIAPSYDEDRKHWDIPPDDVIAGADGTLDVLDVGCGTGLWLTSQRARYSDARVRWAGIDASAGMLAEAKAKAPDLGLVNAFAEAIPLRSNTFDYIYSSFAYHHFADKDAALDEIARVLRSGGTFRIRNIAPEHMPGWWVYRYFPETRALDDLRFWTSERLRDALARRGFDVEVLVEPEARDQPAAEILEEAERRVVSQIAILDDAAYDEGLARLRAADAAQAIETDWAGITITAIKR
jgi:ubiquinone/menaquinone biosynthesis C-methylase UbiE